MQSGVNLVGRVGIATPLVSGHQDATGRARDRCLALGIAIGSGYLFETTFQKEVYSDLTGERGVLMGAIYGLWLAQYEVLREHGHSPSEAFNETVEEATQSLYPLIAENGMDWMYANCSAPAQRGAPDWYRRFRDASKPVETVGGQYDVGGFRRGRRPPRTHRHTDGRGGQRRGVVDAVADHRGERAVTLNAHCGHLVGRRLL